MGQPVLFKGFILVWPLLITSSFCGVEEFFLKKAGVAGSHPLGWGQGNGERIDSAVCLNINQKSCFFSVVSMSNG